MKILLIAAGLAMVSGASSAIAAGERPVTRNAAARAVVYCFDVERTGSYIVTRVCQPADGWSAEGIQVRGR